MQKVSVRQKYGELLSLGGPRNGGVEIMAMPQRNDTIEAIKRLEPPSRVRYGVLGALLEYAIGGRCARQYETIV